MPKIILKEKASEYHTVAVEEEGLTAAEEEGLTAVEEDHTVVGEGASCCSRDSCCA